MKITKKIVFFIAIFAVVCMFSIIHNDADRDLWHRLAVGSIFFQNGWIINHDIFAYTPTKELWIDHEWGSGVIFYGLSHYFGDYGLLALKILFLFSLLAIIFAVHKLISNKNNYRIGFYIISCLALCPGFGSTIRCQVFTYLFFALWIYVLERVRREDNRLIWIFPVTMLVWVNLHGGFLVGFGLLVIYFIGELLNKKNPLKYLYIMALTIPVTLINPYGINFWHYMMEAVTMPRPYITEWEPLNLFGPLKDWLGLKILMAITFVSYGYKLMSKDKKIDWTEIIIMSVTLILSLRQERQAIFFVICASMFAYHYFYGLIQVIIGKFSNKFKKTLSDIDFDQINFAKEAMVFITIIIIAIHISITSSHAIKVRANEYPVEAVEFISINNIKGNLLVPFNWGSYALWKLYPQCLVSIDGRYEEVYPNQVYEDITNFTFFIKNWNMALKKYRNDIILVETNSRTYNKLKEIKEWKEIYQDEYAAVFIPVAIKKSKWDLPDKNNDYSKNKYLNNIKIS